MEKVYLACPYSHEDEAVRELRFEAANKAAAKLIEQGFNVFSPISHSHPIAKYMGNHNNSGFWVEIDLEWIDECDRMVVLKAQGWHESRGVEIETSAAKILGLPIEYMEVI